MNWQKGRKEDLTLQKGRSGLWMWSHTLQQGESITHTVRLGSLKADKPNTLQMLCKTNQTSIHRCYTVHSAKEGGACGALKDFFIKISKGDSTTTIITIEATSIVLYLISKGEHTVLYKINKNGYTKTSKIIIIVNNIVFLTYHTHMHTHTLVCIEAM